MHKRRRAPIQQPNIHVLQDDIESQVLRIRSRLQTLDEMTSLNAVLSDPVIGKQIKEERKSVQLLIDTLTKQYNVSVFEIMGRIGGELLKNQLIEAREKQSQRQGDDDKLYDFVDENQQLAKKDDQAHIIAEIVELNESTKQPWDNPAFTGRQQKEIKNNFQQSIIKDKQGRAVFGLQERNALWKQNVELENKALLDQEWSRYTFNRKTHEQQLIDIQQEKAQLKERRVQYLLEQSSDDEYGSQDDEYLLEELERVEADEDALKDNIQHHDNQHLQRLRSIKHHLFGHLKEKMRSDRELKQKKEAIQSIKSNAQQQRSKSKSRRKHKHRRAPFVVSGMHQNIASIASSPSQQNLSRASSRKSLQQQQSLFGSAHFREPKSSSPEKRGRSQEQKADVAEKIRAQSKLKSRLPSPIEEEEKEQLISPQVKRIAKSSPKKQQHKQSPVESEHEEEEKQIQTSSKELSAKQKRTGLNYKTSQNKMQVYLNQTIPDLKLKLVDMYQDDRHYEFSRDVTESEWGQISDWLGQQKKLAGKTALMRALRQYQP